MSFHARTASLLRNSYFVPLERTSDERKITVDVNKIVSTESPESRIDLTNERSTEECFFRDQKKKKKEWEKFSTGCEPNASRPEASSAVDAACGESAGRPRK